VKDVEYERMASIEARMWWYRNLHHNLLAVAARCVGAPLDAALAGKKVLDAGCGAGGVLMRFEQAAPAGLYYGIDISERAVELARQKSRADIVLGSVDDLPYPNDEFDVILSADVLLHERVEEGRAIDELRRCLKADGVLIVNMPAYKWLRSYHDENVGGARRYSRAEVRRLFAGHRMRTRIATYWNTVFFPAMVAKRKVLPNKGDKSDVELMAEPLEALFFGLTALERALIRAGASLPYGGSVMWAGERDEAA
jgi:ubiquinone/menaquinone biosynthesis C-methylase UbiE